MKQYMKRVLLVLSMVVSLFALSACSNKNAAEAETMDPQTASYISQISENLLQTIAEMDEATAEESETGLLKQGEDGLASGLDFLDRCHEGHRRVRKRPFLRYRAWRG